MDHVIPKLLRKNKLLKRKSKSTPFDNIDEICIESMYSRRCSELKGQELLNYQLDTCNILMEYENIKGDPLKVDKTRELVREFCQLVGEPIINTDYLIDNKFCIKCDTSEYIYESESSAELVCHNCGNILNKLIGGGGLSYSEKADLSYKVKIDYKKINYFSEWLMQIQGKEKTLIPSSLINAVKEEIYQQKIDKIDPVCLRKILKLTNNSRYYEHIPIIISKLNGLKPLDIPEPIEEIMKYMFYKVQEYWEKDTP